MIEKAEIIDMATWGFDLPLTPPSSPCNMMDLEDETQDLCYRLQPICQSSTEDTVDEILFHNTTKICYKTDSIVIKDCMWGAHDIHASSLNAKFSLSTRCSSSGELPRQPTVAESASSDSCCNKFFGVDPAEVFPALDERINLKEISSSESDDDTDIDVVTVEPNNAQQKVEDLFPKSPDIITPPKTPDSLPDTNNNNNNTFGQMIVDADSSDYLSSSSSSSNVERNTTATSRSYKISATSPSPSSRSLKDLPDSFSRASHNVLERKRRNELKSKFYGLRDSVPELTGNKKVPKVVILKKAIDYITTVQEEENLLKSEVQRQKKLQQELKKRLITVLRSPSSSS